MFPLTNTRPEAIQRCKTVRDGASGKFRLK